MQAFILSRFFNLVLMDYWQDTVDYGQRLTSSNDLQGHPNPDGTTTYVVSKMDPGIHNWIDTAGLNHPKLMLRWQQLPRDASAKEPSVETQLVSLDELDSVLPDYVKRITPDERKQQLAERLSDHNVRFADH